MQECNMFCTLGPSCKDPKVIAELINQGITTIRINFSHGTCADHTEYYNNIKEAEKIAGRKVHIFGDIQGPKLRINKFAGGPQQVVKGQSFILDESPLDGDNTRVYLPHPEFFDVCQVGDAILINDGIVVVECTKNHTNAAGIREIVTKVVREGTISDRKGVALPARVLPLSTTSPRDVECIENACAIGIECIMLSFIQTADDVRAAKKIINGRAKVMPKIEKPTAVLDLHEICKECEIMLIARGDLAVETKLCRVNYLQKYITDVCRQHNVKIVCATQHLESLIELETPTIAEMSDIANAIYDGCDGILVTGECASGLNSANTISWLKKAILATGATMNPDAPLFK
ncbi:Pyruvate kinase [Spironucleus salmonicida]|uniref:Pyruvate kinase n=1 Tax=Spironucleus salmonicida TaxID=348837 RepID=V6LRS9_9EUKA|nr:Pyruvate kinase [Spironucleus salmonicida]KAH0572860.1 Pyruvate kinase [Spironucleus salmonicida]|eukprot:EST43489.1 Pyruvate kinase [Spironucleus salmonicida]